MRACVHTCVLCAQACLARARACFLHVFLGFFSGHLLAPARALRIEHPFGARGGSTVFRSRCGEIRIATMMYVPKMRTCSVHVHRSAHWCVTRSRLTRRGVTWTFDETLRELASLLSLALLIM